MVRRTLAASVFAVAGGALAIVSSISGCGLETYGLPEGDASLLDQILGDDAASDATPDDATTGSDGTASMDGGDAGSGDSSSADTGPTCASGFSCGVLGCMATCQGCPGSPFACVSKGTCESSCGTCPSHDVECYVCDSGLPVGRCDTHAASECLGANYQHCSCAILPCLSLTQVCTDVPGLGIHSQCRTCGEDHTNGGACGILQNCNAAATTCN